MIPRPSSDRALALLAPWPIVTGRLHRATGASAHRVRRPERASRRRLPDRAARSRCQPARRGP